MCDAAASSCWPHRCCSVAGASAAESPIEINAILPLAGFGAFLATTVQLRVYVSGLDHFVGIAGTYDFKKVPQRGVGVEAAILYQWSPAKDDFVIVSKPSGVRP